MASVTAVSAVWEVRAGHCSNPVTPSKPELETPSPPSLQPQRTHILALPLAGLALGGGLAVGAEVHVGGVEPQEEGLVLGLRLGDKGLGLLKHLVIDRLHALLGERAGVLVFAVNCIFLFFM